MNAAGDRLAVGAWKNDGSGDNAGHVRMYALSSGSWSQMGSDIDAEAAGDYMGWSLSMNAAGDRVAIGAYQNDGNGTDAGHVRIYSWDGTSWSQLGSDIDGEAAGDNFGFSVSMNPPVTASRSVGKKTMMLHHGPVTLECTRTLTMHGLSLVPISMGKR